MALKKAVYSMYGLTVSTLVIWSLEAFPQIELRICIGFKTEKAPLIDGACAKFIPENKESILEVN